MSKPAIEYTNHNHDCAVNMLGYCFTLTETDMWLAAIDVLRVRLAEDELASLAFVILNAMHPDDAALVVEAMQGRAGTPDVPFISAMDQAAYWADWADLEYIKACVLAGYNKMPQHDQRAFLDFVQGKAAA